MYTNPVQYFEFHSFTDGDLVVQFETAGILTLLGRNADAATDGTALLDSILVPNGGQLEEFGVILTEAITGAGTACVFKMQGLQPLDDTVATLVTMTLPAAAANVTVNNVYASDTANGSVTAAQAVAIGARLIVDGSRLPVTIEPGSRVYAELTTAASAGGAGRVYCAIRFNGAPSPGAAVDSPITKLLT